MLDARPGAGDIGGVGNLASRSNRHQGRAWYRTTVIAMKPAHLISDALRIVVCTKGISSLVHAAASLAQAWGCYALYCGSAADHTVDARVLTVVGGIESDALLGAVEVDSLRCMHSFVHERAAAWRVL